jgi:hypothetical protein
LLCAVPAVACGRFRSTALAIAPTAVEIAGDAIAAVASVSWECDLCGARRQDSAKTAIRFKLAMRAKRRSLSNGANTDS